MYRSLLFQFEQSLNIVLMLGDGHARDQLLAKLVVHQMVPGNPPDLQILRILFLVDDLQFDLDAPFVLQRQPIADHLRADAVLWRDPIVDGPFYHLQDVGRLQLRTHLGQLELEGTGVFVQVAASRRSHAVLPVEILENLETSSVGIGQFLGYLHLGVAGAVQGSVADVRVAHVAALGVGAGAGALVAWKNEEEVRKRSWSFRNWLYLCLSCRWTASRRSTRNFYRSFSSEKTPRAVALALRAGSEA